MPLTTESCAQCERLTVILESNAPLGGLAALPATFDHHKKRHVWKGHGFFGYAVIPRSVEGKRGTVDVYFCFDEDDLDDIDVGEFAAAFLKERVFPRWKNFRVTGVSGVVQAAPEGIACRKLRHTPLGEPLSQQGAE